LIAECEENVKECKHKDDNNNNKNRNSKNGKFATRAGKVSCQTIPSAIFSGKEIKEEINQLCSYGVLRKINNSEWACPMFTIANPVGSLQSLADLWEVNKVIKQKPYPLPKISDMLQKLEGFMYATSLDLNMGYYHMILTPFARQFCTIVLPWG
jgi:hypothetical protein